MNPGPEWAVSPTDWGARVDYDQWTDAYTPDDGIALHHGGPGDCSAGREPFSQDKEMAQLRVWEAFHIDSRGWRGLAYGWAIGQTGTLYRIRGWNTYGAHTGDIDGDGISNNSEIIPILLILSGNHHDPSPEMQSSIARHREYIESEAPEATYLYGHQEVQPSPTTCPGPKIMAYIEANRYLTEETDDMPFLPLRAGDTGPDPRMVKDMLARAYNITFSERNAGYDDEMIAAVAEHLGGSGQTIRGDRFEHLLHDYVVAVAPGGFMKRAKQLFVRKGTTVIIGDPDV